MSAEEHGAGRQPGPEEIFGEVVAHAIDRYRAGLCNIGPRERAFRLVGGVVAAAATVAAYAWLRARGAPPVWRLAVGLPALAAAVGLEQARKHFCVDNAARGVYNLDQGDRRVEDAADRRADRHYAAAILARCVLIAALVAIAAFFL